VPEPRPAWQSLGLNLPFAGSQMDGATPRWADILAMARAGEDAGVDAVWISDHVGFGDPGGDWSGAWESWTLLSALAAATTQVRLGTYVLAMPYRNPAMLAKMAETLDEISGGRVILGVGAGWNEPEFASYDFPWEGRFTLFEEGLRILVGMLREGRATVDGRYARAFSARLEPRGPRPDGLPVMVGAAGPRMLRLAAELADEWNAGMRTPAAYAAMSAELDAALDAVGRDRSSIRRSVEAMVRPGGDAPAGDPDQLGNGDHPISGTPEAIAAALDRYHELGADHAQVQLRPNRLETVSLLRPVIQVLAPG
jgi:alkanesulfonate monooxygenase SsuD/methylene tetrahydromethanopterin reductase-like flavin-dependent oxidoreductase (luciferase family)